jgi:CxxC motif-containing protein (DUF1111 family)
VHIARVHELWPPATRTRGRPPEHDWDAIHAIARAAAASRAGISRNALAASVISEYGEKVCSTRVPDISQVVKKLRDWGLPSQN